MAPPYDVITPEDRERYYRLDPHNVVRLIAGEVRPTDHPGDSKYTRAAAFFNDWLRTGVLRREPSPCFYVYRQTFPDSDGARRARDGILAVVALEPFGEGIMPHERTHARARTDQMSLTESTDANLSPVWALYYDPSRTLKQLMANATRGAPRLQIPWEEGEEHAVWCLRGETEFRQMAATLSSARLFLADGHHRYQVALGYRNRQRAAHPEAPPTAAFNYVLTLLVDADDPNLRILPTHRLLGEVEGFNGDALLERLRSRHVVLDFADFQALDRWLHEPAGNHRFGIVLPWRFAGLQVAAAATDDPVARLDISVLHRQVLERELGLREGELEGERHLTYLRDAPAAVARVQSGEGQAAFLLRPPSVAEVVAVASAAGVMPQKTTYFYPKPLSGIVFNPLSPSIVIPEV